MITKFHIFEKHEDIDPYGEEVWGDNDLIEIFMETPLKVGDEIYDFENEYYGVIVEVITDNEFRVNKYDAKIQWVSKMGFNIFGYKVKTEKQFEHNDIDPYGEEDWTEPEVLDDKDLTKITMKTVLKIGDVIYTPKNAYHGVITNIVKMEKYSPYYVVNTGIKKINSSLWTFYTFGYKLKVK